MNSIQRFISFGLIALLAATVGSWLFYSQSSTFWSKDLETAFPSSAWLLVCLVLTILVFGIAYACSKAIAKALILPSWLHVIATPAFAIPVLNLSTGYLFARLNGVDNVHGFPLNRPGDLFADQVLLFMAGAFIGFGIWLAGVIWSWIWNKLKQRTKFD